MQRVILALAVLFSLTASAQTLQSDQQKARAASSSFGDIRNRTLNEALRLCMNNGGVDTCLMQLNSGNVWIGNSTAVAPNEAAGAHRIYGAITPGVLDTTDGGGGLGLFTNLYLSAGNAHRTQTTLTGAGLRILPRTSNSNAAFAFLVNSTGDSTTTAPVNTALGLANGSWTFGDTVGANSFEVQSGTETTFIVNGGALSDTQATVVSVRQSGSEMTGLLAYNPVGGIGTTGVLQLRSSNLTPTYFWADNTSARLKASGAIGDVGGAGGAFVGEQTSDLRLKENIRPYSDGMNVVKQLKPTRYKFKGDPKEHIGFIAQEVEAVLPEVVTVPRHENQYYTMEGRDIIPALVNALKELSAENAAIKARLTALEQGQ